MLLWPGSTEREMIGDALKWQRCAMGNTANFLMWILEEGEASETRK